MTGCRAAIFLMWRNGDVLSVPCKDVLSLETNKTASLWMDFWKFSLPLAFVMQFAPALSTSCLPLHPQSRAGIAATFVVPKGQLLSSSEQSLTFLSWEFEGFYSQILSFLSKPLSKSNGATRVTYRGPQVLPSRDCSCFSPSGARGSTGLWVLALTEAFELPSEGRSLSF